jgi:hypothetical protein
MRILKLNPVARAIGVISAVAIVVSGVTYATFVDSASLTGNSATMASANANLLLWDATANDFLETTQGFTFEDLEPGDESAKHDFYFKNDGNVDLFLTASIPEAPELPEGITGDKVTFKFYGQCGEEPVSATWTELVEGEVDLPCEPLDEDAQGVIGDLDNDANFAVTVTFADDLEIGDEEQEVSGFNIVFNGYTDDDDTGGAPAPETP